MLKGDLKTNLQAVEMSLQPPYYKRVLEVLNKKNGLFNSLKMKIGNYSENQACPVQANITGALPKSLMSRNFIYNNNHEKINFVSCLSLDHRICI